MQKLSDARIIQPNLTCSYNLLGVPGNMVRSLIATNKDAGVGIADPQVPAVFWAWAIEFYRQLKKQGFEPPREIPSCDSFLQLSRKADVVSLTFISVDKDLMIEDAVFLIVLQNWCATMANALGVRLDIPEDIKNEYNGQKSDPDLHI